MPSETKTTPRPSTALEGAVFMFASDAERCEAIEKAFDYRGDITLELTGGERIEGYLSNRDAVSRPPRVEIFPKGSDEMRTIPYADILGIAFSGRDMADGKSWRSWMEKKESERQAEAEKLRRESEALGHL